MAGERILVVDDEEDIRRVFQDFFTMLGYQVVTAESGSDALKKFVPGEFDCVLCDLVMPKRRHGIPAGTSRPGRKSGLLYDDGPSKRRNCT